MPDLPPGMPRALRNLRRDSVGRPVPYFVEWIDGKPDFRIMNGKHLHLALLNDLCWVCGERLKRLPGTYTFLGTFVAGPMCLVNGNSAEPPCHYTCAEWSARACPFLNNPNKVRREANLPEDWAEAAGISIKRNPGVTALISTSHWKPYVEGDGVLVRFWNPTSVEWLCEGREATAEEVAYSLSTGLPDLYRVAAEESPEAVAALDGMVAAAERWLPGDHS